MLRVFDAQGCERHPKLKASLGQIKKKDRLQSRGSVMQRSRSKIRFDEHHGRHWRLMDTDK